MDYQNEPGSKNEVSFKFVKYSISSTYLPIPSFICVAILIQTLHWDSFQLGF